MRIEKKLNEELVFLNDYNSKAITISTTSKHSIDFRLLPRRVYKDEAISSFMINDETLLKETLRFYNGKVDKIYIDVEQKQQINLYSFAKKEINETKLIPIKPNDMTLESTDLLIRNQLKDNLYNRNVIVIGNGNLASKLAIRLAERQANVFMLGRQENKEKKIIGALNLLLPKFAQPIQSYKKNKNCKKADLIVSFLSGQFTEENIIYPVIDTDTLIIDGGISNFSKDFIQKVLSKGILIIRLDTRIALPYQTLSQDKYIKDFFQNVFGVNSFNGIPIVSGGFIGEEGSVIVDNLKSPSQVVGIADGRGGVRSNEQLSETDKERVQRIQQNLSKFY